MVQIRYRVAIIGGAGYVGSSLARYFLKDFDVKVLDLAPLLGDLEEKVAYAKCDVREFEDVVAAIDDADLVINTAIVQIPLINEQKRLGYAVNVLGTQNICKAVDENPRVRGMILAGTWHVIGERRLSGLIDEEFGFRPDKVEERAILYALSKITQETIVRFYDEFSDKVFGILRMGTVLGERMPEKTAANTFIDKGLRGEPITPYSHSMYRPMLYVDVGDVCTAFRNFATKILDERLEKGAGSLTHIVNLYYPDPVTILELAEMVRTSIIKHTNGKVNSRVEIVDTHPPTLFSEENKKHIKVDVSKAMNFLQLRQLKSPKESIDEIVRGRVSRLRALS